MIKPCLNCKELFQGALRAKYCSVSCQTPEETRECLWCGTYFTTKNIKIFCKRACMYKYRAVHPTPIRVLICPECGIEFESKHHRTKFHSNACKNRYKNKNRTKKVKDITYGRKKPIQLSSAACSDKFQARWELLWDRHPQLHKAMLQIESEVPIYEV